LNVLMYTPCPPEFREQYMCALAPLVSRGSIEVFPGLVELLDRLRKPKDPLSLAIFFGPSKEDLRALIARRELFSEMKTLLVLPDEDEETVHLAHRALATFITYVDSPMSDLTGVVKKLIESSGS
jgi:hypothetical protein